MNTTITTKSEQGGNPDQQNHNPQLHRQNFRTQTQNSTQFFFNNYIETKLKDIQQLHKDKLKPRFFGPKHKTQHRFSHAF